MSDQTAQNGSHNSRRVMNVDPAQSELQVQPAPTLSELPFETQGEQGQPARDVPRRPDLRTLTFWRVEGSLAALGAIGPVAYFTWNSHTFAGRWARRGGMLLLALIRPFLYACHRVFATRVLHTLLSGRQNYRQRSPIYHLGIYAHLVLTYGNHVLSC